MHFKIEIKSLFKLTVLIILSIFLSLPSLSNTKNGEEESIFKGYITNKVYKPLKLSVFEIDKSSIFFLERNIEDNSYEPTDNLKITTENKEDYYININNKEIFIPRGAMFIGYIKEVVPGMSFDRGGYFRVAFDKAICPGGEIFNLNTEVTSKSQKVTYNPIKHIGKTTANLIGGALAGTVVSYQLGGLGLIAGTHGYSLAASATGGGFIGTLAGLYGPGMDAKIEPGDNIDLLPVNEISLDQLKQIKCAKTEALTSTVKTDKDIDLQIISVKEKKDFSGEQAIRIDIQFINNSDNAFRLSNFFLRDSQGKEYTASFIDLKDNIFTEFPPRLTKKAVLQFLVEHPKAKHWLVLKDKNYTHEIGVWEIARKS